MLDTFKDVDNPSQAEVDAFTARLEPGSTTEGGQALIRSAIGHFIEARSEPDPTHKAELVLLANSETGLHEQIRLQPYIANSMDAAVVHALDRLHSIPPRIGAMERVVHRALKPKTAKWLTHAFETANTRLYATAHLPTGQIHLGKPIPTPEGEDPYPSDLMEIEHSDLTAVLHRYDSLKPSSKQIPTRDWRFWMNECISSSSSSAAASGTQRSTSSHSPPTSAPRFALGRSPTVIYSHVASTGAVGLRLHRLFLNGKRRL